MPGFDQTTPINSGRTLVGRYRLVAPIARGGMAEVWEGHDDHLDRAVAVKILQPHLATDSVFFERFRREAVTAARLAHPAVVQTYDAGVDGGTAFIVMELVRGRTLRQLLSEHGRLEPWQAVAIARQIADALAAAHQAALVHRDIKPANVLLVEGEWGGPRVKVTDFGIAKASAGVDQDLTRTGTVLGTPKYLSPEQIKGEDPDARADLYSLGVVMYEMLVGSPPYSGDTDMTIAMAHLNDRIPKVSSKVAEVPTELDRLVGDLLAKDPARRVPSAAALRQRLDALGPLAPPAAPSADTGGGQPGSHRGPEPGAAATTVLAGGGSGGRAGAGDGTLPLERTSVVDRSGPSGPSTGELSHPVLPSVLRNGRAVGYVVLGLMVVGALVAAILLSDQGKHNQGAAGAPTTSPVAVSISGVTVFMDNDRTPDNADQTRFTFDGNPATFWTTDHYDNPTFSNLYSGIGLAIELGRRTSLHKLAVTSDTVGWAASTYVSDTPISTGQPVSAWGSPTDSESSLSGDATFNLGGRTGQYVLLWITNLGSADQAQVAELGVS